MKYFIVLALVCLLAGCKALFGTSYQGQFHPQKGECKESGKVTIDATDKELEMTFFCFLEECAEGEGKVSQGGYFQIYIGNNQYIKGRISPGDRSRGEWQLKLKGKECAGYWTASELD